MTARKLTPCGSSATSRTMIRGRRILPGAVLLPVMLGGCINVNAPAEPIVIELNINIKQEVIYRLAEDARQNAEENPEIF